MFLETEEETKSTDLLNPHFCHPSTEHYQISQALLLRGQFAKYNTARSER